MIRGFRLFSGFSWTKRRKSPKASNDQKARGRRGSKVDRTHEYDDMDTILAGILKSDHDIDSKRRILKKIVDKGEQIHPSNVTLPVLNLTSEWFLDGESDLVVSAGWEIFVSWAKHNQSSLETFFSRDFLVSLLTVKYRNEANPPLMMHQCMRIVPNKTRSNSQKIIEASAIKFIQENLNTVCLRNFVIFLEEFKDCVPRGKYRLKFCESLIEALSKGKAPKNSNDIFQFVKDVARIVQFIHQVWQSADSSFVLDCLKNVFYILCDTTPEEPSDCLGSLLTCVPTDVCSTVIKQAVQSDLVDNDAMILALQRMVNWLNWPSCINVDKIIIMFLKELADQRKYTVLITVTESKVENVMDKLQYSPVREASFNILSHMLLSFQHSAVPFHKIIPQVKGTVAILQKEKTKESLACLSNLAELLYCLMSHHTGFPDLYEPLIELIKMYPKPSEGVIQMKLAENKWGGACSTTITDVSGLHKSETGKIGLLNVGNTCYMNSIIQTLFMCDEFRYNVLTHPIRVPGNILSKLQEVFAYLKKSQRPAIAPDALLEASRPPWFTNGCQQDCSEFLKYLLDQMHEQEKLKSITQGTPSKTIVEDTFGGKMSSTVTCLTCNHESTKVEEFIDIPLAFPHNTKSSKRLVGGSSDHSITSVEQEQNIDAKAVDKSGSLHLNDLIRHYLETEKLTGDNKYFCDNCKGLQEGESNIKIEVSPQYLVLTLLRFSYDVKLQCRSKIFREVKYPETLVLPIQAKKSPEQFSKRLKPNNVPSDVYETLMGDDDSVIGVDKEVYGLCSVIVHSGASSECGHYYCYARHSTPTGKPHISDNVDKIDFLENKWHLFNDCRVSYTSYESFSNVTQRFNRDTAYVLVYRKISPSEFDGQPTIVKEPSIISKLRAEIDKDNSKYLQEQEEANKQNIKARERSSSTSSYYSRREDEEPPPDCGGSSGLDSLDTVGARFIF